MIFFDKKSKRREVRSVPHKNFLRTPLKFSAQGIFTLIYY